VSIKLIFSKNSSMCPRINRSEKFGETQGGKLKAETLTTES
jgi:hypothetical protein